MSAASSNANKAFNLSSVSGFGEHVAYQLTTQATSAAVTAALKGDSVSDSLEGALTNAIGNSIGAVGFYQGANLAEHFGLAEGSVGRALIHAGTGAIVGEIMHDDAAGGAAGAFVSSLAGPGLEQLNASFGGSAAKLAGLVQATGALGAALLTGETSSVVAGQVTGALVDQYNRQLHTDEIKFLQDKDRIRRFASEYGLTESQAAKELARSAAGSMDAGWDQALSANDGDTSRGRAFLANEVKASGRTDLFQVTAAEYANERMGLQELFRDRNSINFMVGNVALVNPVTYRSDPRYRNVILDAKGRGSTDGIGEMLSGTWEAITHLPETAQAAVEGILNLPQSLSQGWENFQYKGALDTLHVMQGDVYGVIYGNAKGSTQLGMSLVPASGLGLGAGRLIERLGVDGDVVSNTTVLSYKPSSGVVLQAQEGRTTTILGSWENDMRSVVSELGNVKSTDFGPRPGGFNILNVPDNLYRNPRQFWTEYNEPWLGTAVQRGDNFLMATKPAFNVTDVKTGFSVLARPNPITGKMELSGYGREYLMIKRAGYTYQNGMMLK